MYLLLLLLQQPAATISCLLLSVSKRCACKAALPVTVRVRLPGTHILSRYLLDKGYALIVSIPLVHPYACMLSLGAGGHALLEQ